MLLNNGYTDSGLLLDRKLMVGDKVRLSTGNTYYCIRPHNENEIVVWNGRFNFVIDMKDVLEWIPTPPEFFTCKKCKIKLEETEFRVTEDGCRSKTCMKCLV